MEEKKHSGLGIASFIISIVSGLFIFIVIIIAGVLEATTPGGISQDSLAAAIVGICVFAFLGASVVGLGLGIGGIAQKARKKIFAILGTVFSALTLVGTILLMALGFSMG